MKNLGVVQNITHKGEILVRASFAPRPGTGVLDSRKQPVGRVKRVFGPVEAPYVLISAVRNRNLTYILNQKVFVR